MREQRIRRKRMPVRPSLSKKMGNTLLTSQGMSTLKIVIIYSILGMILNWVVPHLLLHLYPVMPKEEAQYLGTLGAIIITGFLLIVSLINGIVKGNRSRKEDSEAQPTNTALFERKDR